LSIKNKTISGLKWSFTDNLVNQIVHFVIGLVLARLLSPSEYGVVGMTTVFISISLIFIQSGLGTALIRKQNCTDADYNTMFYSNIGIGFTTFIILFFSAGAIAKFYNNPDLFLLVRVMAVNLIINSFGLVETAMLTKKIDFKRQTKISLIANVSSGIIGIVLAILGFSYWSLAIRTLCHNLFRVLLLHYTSSWKPKLMYSIDSFRELFGFGVKLLGSNLVATVYKNIHSLIIGKFYSAAALGFYSKAQMFNHLFSTNIVLTTQRVTYPVLSALQHDNARFRAGYRKTMKLLFFITSVLMSQVIINSSELVHILLGSKWATAAIYMRIISLTGILYPLHSLNLNAINAKGRSDLALRLELIKKAIAIPLLIVGAYFGLIPLLWSMVISSVIDYFLNSFYSGKLIGYSTKQQILDLAPSALLITFVSMCVYAIAAIVNMNVYFSFIFKASSALFLIYLIGKLFKLFEVVETQRIFLDQISAHLILAYKRVFLKTS
jgi:O-antigen/teichoic acid export membrane protein